jgi:phytoene synthase
MSAARIGELRTESRAALELLYSELRARGMGAPASADGQLIRPLLSLAGAAALGIERDARFWSAAAAVQLAHEASLLHDDVIDGAAVRRAAPTLAAARGVGAALVEGDHLLTTAYRLAAASGSPDFFSAFSHAVERTVAGEKLQGRATGMLLDEGAYRRIIAGKSGELLGCALAAGAYAASHPAAASLYVLGRRIGELYQMLDDLLDYCPDAETGKPPLADYRQRRWTWPLLELNAASFDEPEDGVAERFATCDESGTSPLRRCAQRFERECDSVRVALAVHLPGDRVIEALVREWCARAAAAAASVERAVLQRRLRTVLAARVPPPAALPRFFAANSRTFSFAARAFPRAFRDQVTGVYAFCRITDDIVDGDLPSADSAALLECWIELARAAHAGTPSGIALLDDVMGAAARAGVPFHHVEQLAEGMRMDLRGERYASAADLRVYSYRVAGVIGQWLTRLSGVHDTDVLERAADLGHALQLTNILRDVGDDLRAGRVYLPTDMMRAAGVDETMLHAMSEGAPVTPAYRALMEQLMARADAHYARALAATPALPAGFRTAVRVAAHVYRGIHDEIRAAGYDNLRRRAHTSAARKMTLAVHALRGRILEPAAAAAVRDAAVPSLHAPRRARRSIRTALVALLVIGAAAPAARAQVPAVEAHVAAAQQRVAADSLDAAARIDLVRALFFHAVDHETSVVRGHAAVAEVRTRLPDAAAAHAPLLTAYEGAFTALEAKHGFWPHARLRAVRRGLGLLDSAVSAAPTDLEIRYLRMVNGFFLPGLFGRSESVRADLAVLERVLPGSVSLYPAGLFRAMAGFVLEHGSPAPANARLLRDVLDHLDHAARTGPR